MAAEPTTGAAPDATRRELLRTAILGQWRFVLPASVFAMVHQACEAAVPVLIGIGVDSAIARQDPTALVGVLVGFVTLFAVLTASMRAGGRLVRRATQGAGHALRVDVARRSLHPRGIDRDVVAPGEVFSIATSDAQRVGMVNAAVWTAAGAVAALVVGAVLLLQASVVLGLVVIVGLVPVFLVTRVVSRPLVRRSGAEQAAAATAAGTATDLLTGLRVLTGLGAETVAAARYALASAAARQAGTRAAALVAVRTSMITALTGVFLAVVAVVGGGLAVDGSISVGEFVAALGLTQFLLGPFTRIAMVGAQVARAQASADRVATLLAAPYAVGPGTAVAPGSSEPELRFRGLRAATGPAIDLTVDAGTFVGIVPTAPGAAEALLAVLGREVEPAAGELLLDGVPLSGMDPVVARQVIHVTRHDEPLFTGTLGGNIAFGAPPGCDPPPFEECAHAADADQVAATVPGGYDAPVTERGRSLSGGQRQRIALARALTADAPVLVLHDPTTAVDAVTEAAIAERLRALRAGRTTLVVSTSPALLAVADRVVVLDGDGVAAEGTHAALAARDERYRELVLS